MKGPTAKMMIKLGLGTDVLAVARHYDGLIDGMILDFADERPVEVRPTLMLNQLDRDELARSVLCFADRLFRGSQSHAQEGLGQ